MFQQLAIKARACLGQFDPRALAQLVKAFLDLNRKDLVGQSMSHDLSHPKRDCGAAYSDNLSYLTCLTYLYDT